MYTRCPACHTVHPVNAALLSQGGGRYRCGKCSKTSSALESLFDNWPEAGDKPSKAAELPVLGLPIDLDKAKLSRLMPEEAGLGEAEGKEAAFTPSSPNRLLRTFWVMAAIAITIFVVVGLENFSQQPESVQAETPSIPVILGLKEPKPTAPFRDLTQIHLVSRELISQPSQSGMLRLNATIVNRANLRQAFPVLEVTLLDTSGGAIANYRFEPSEYLSDKARAGKGMTPHAFLPLSLEVDDPGLQAVGFELQFH